MKKLTRLVLVISLSVITTSVFAEGQMDNTECEYMRESNTRNNPKVDLNNIEEIIKPLPSNSVTKQ